MLEMNNWKTVWEKRQVDQTILKSADKGKILAELKRVDGFDITEGGLDEKALLQQYEMTKKNLSHGPHASIELQQVYEVGCGGGANLFLFEDDGLGCGGIDYSESLIAIAGEVLHTKDLVCDEACHMPELPAYDGVFSNSVFSYFPDEGYAERVLEKMLVKSRFSIGILDIHDVEKKEDFLTYRKKTIENYEKLYRDLPKLFYSRSFFQKFAQEHELDLIFPCFDMPGYWNNDFIFHCFMYKRGYRECSR